MRLRFQKLCLLPLLLSLTPAFSASKVDLSKHGVAYLAPYFSSRSAPQISALTLSLKTQPMIKNQSALAAKGSKLIASQTHTDFNGTAHYRFNQTYLDYPVWGAQAVIHSYSASHVTMNGAIYENLQKDLGSVSPFSEQLKDQIASQSLNNSTPEAVQPIVYIDKNNGAHWAYLLSYSMDKPVRRIKMIVDVKTQQVLQRWSDLHTSLIDKIEKKFEDAEKKKQDNAARFEDVLASGYGGNAGIGEYVFGEAFPKLLVKRDVKNSLCYLENNDVAVENAKDGNRLYEFSCKANPNHLYHNDYDKVNGAFSPSNDAFYAGEVIKKLYREWYGIPALKNSNGTPMQINMHVHYGDRYENAYWDSQNHYMVFGDGDQQFYPMTSVGIVAHEVSHGFTQQHANLIYMNQSGALNEAFSDMAAQAAEFYAFGESSWLIGERVTKTAKPLRYMYDPTQDGVSIGNARDYGWFVNAVKRYTDDLGDQQDIIVHCTSGVYNKFFYVLATSQNWDTKKAFSVVVKANQDYWTPSATFKTAACGVISAAADYAKQDVGYDLVSVKNAFTAVGIDTSQCQQQASSVK